VLDDRGAAREVDRLVLLVPAHAIALVPGPPEHLEDLAAPWLPAADQVNLDPVAGLRRDVGTGDTLVHGSIEPPDRERVIRSSSQHRTESPR
jgi:hypothetical protein